MAKKYSFLYVTVPEGSEAEILAQKLVDEKLAACVNLLPGMKSLYPWKGKIEKSEEVVAIFKTTQAKVKKARDRILALHPYDVPCVIEIKLGSINRAYENWLNNALCVSKK